MNLVRPSLESIAGIEIIPVISLVIFVVFFLAVTRYVLRLDKNKVDKMASLALDNEENEAENHSGS